ncbi:hypothetical protein DFH06DRAFT_1325645 [Mycena polygramma]|nr:hypothetical protein DFH06DRAFT_1325645 [Mycena polygramma]
MTPWQSHIRSEMCSWIINLFQTRTGNRPSLYEPYSSVIAKLCQYQIEYEFGDAPERALGLTYQVLCNTWGDFELTTPEHMRTFLVPWLRCTGLVLFYTNFFLRPRTDFKTAFRIPLRDALLRAAAFVGDPLPANNRSDDEAIPGEWKEVLEITANLLEKLAIQTPKDPEPGDAVVEADLDGWKWVTDGIYTLKTALKKVSVPLQQK